MKEPGHLATTKIDVLREWFGGERYARDYEFIDASFGAQAEAVARFCARVEAAVRAAALEEAMECANMYDGPVARSIADDIENLSPSAAAEITALRARVAVLEGALAWVDTWVSNPSGSYSVEALNGLFGMTRDRLAALAGEKHGQS